MAGRAAGPDLTFERAAMARGLALVAGVDEAGCGPWAGPVVAAAVILDPDNVPAGIDDSKRLSAERRAELFDEIARCALAVSFALGDVERIDRDNILNARLWAMAEAVAGLALAPAHALVDGNRTPLLACPLEAVVGGDGRCLSIAAASIVAKVTRDRIMERLAAVHPEYGFERHKGYGTAEHRAALARHGPCPQHRRSFQPVFELHVSVRDEPR
jgi:ribonuclease HII